MLPTAIVTLGNGGPRTETIRALVDSCSEASLITLALARRLGASQSVIRVNISGVSGSVMDSARVMVRIYLHEADRRRRLPLQAYGLSRIEIVTPQATLPYTSTSVCEDSTLADPTFRSSGKVESILDADVFSDIVLPGVMRRDNILAQSTIFGWILTGTTRARDISLSNLDGRSTFTLATGARSTEECAHHEILIELVRRFWALEEVPHIRTISQAEVDCEEQFVKGFFRQADGRYVVPLPL